MDIFGAMKILIHLYIPILKKREIHNLETILIQFVLGVICTDMFVNVNKTFEHSR